MIGTRTRSIVIRSPAETIYRTDSSDVLQFASPLLFSFKTVSAYIYDPSNVCVNDGYQITSRPRCHSTRCFSRSAPRSLIRVCWPKSASDPFRLGTTTIPTIRSGTLTLPRRCICRERFPCSGKAQSYRCATAAQAPASTTSPLRASDSTLRRPNATTRVDPEPNACL